MGLLMILFFVGAIVLGALIFFGMLDAHVMPISCPRCNAGGDDGIAGTHVPWYRSYGRTVRCRSCYTSFKEHPNGSLVEDR